MKYTTVAKTAAKWGISERSVRDYCAQGRVDGARRCGKTWQIPADTQKPKRKNAKQKNNELLIRLKQEKESHMPGGIYHKLQIELTYNSNHIEGSKLSKEQTRLIFETKTIGAQAAVSVDDIIETNNHFKCVDYVIDNCGRTLTQNYIKHLHKTLKSSTSDAEKEWFAVGEYKKLPNEVGGRKTAHPRDVHKQMEKLLNWYNDLEHKSINELIEFHVRFERIHPFQDGNGRIGRLILLKECLANNIVPFIISDELKDFYYRGLHEYDEERGYLVDTCLHAQDVFKSWLNYFEIMI